MHILKRWSTRNIAFDSDEHPLSPLSLLHTLSTMKASKSRLEALRRKIGKEGFDSKPVDPPIPGFLNALVHSYCGHAPQLVPIDWNIHILGAMATTQSKGNFVAGVGSSVEQLEDSQPVLAKPVPTQPSIEVPDTPVFDPFLHQDAQPREEVSPVEIPPTQPDTGVDFEEPAGDKDNHIPKRTRPAPVPEESDVGDSASVAPPRSGGRDPNYFKLLGSGSTGVLGLIESYCNQWILVFKWNFMVTTPFTFEMAFWKTQRTCRL